MHNDLLDILSHRNIPLTNEQLIAYLNGTLSDDERHKVESAFIDNNIDNEAIEGLQLVSNTAKIHQVESDLHKALREKLAQPKRQRKRLKDFSINWLLIITACLLALIFFCWLIIHWLQQAG